MTACRSSGSCRCACRRGPASPRRGDRVGRATGDADAAADGEAAMLGLDDATDGGGETTADGETMAPGSDVSGDAAADAVKAGPGEPAAEPGADVRAMTSTRNARTIRPISSAWPPDLGGRRGRIDARPRTARAPRERCGSPATGPSSTHLAAPPRLPPRMPPQTWRRRCALRRGRSRAAWRWPTARRGGPPRPSELHADA